MNKKLYLLIILTLILTPIVSALLMEGVENTLEAIFDATGDLVYIKAGIWVLLFFLIFKSAERIFPENRGLAFLFALLFSTIGTRYMPEEYLDYIGGGYAIILAIIIFLIPYLGGSIIGDLLRFGKKGKTFLIIAFYAAFAYGLLRWEGFPLEQEAMSILYDVLYWITEHNIITLVIIVLICIYFLRGFRKREGPKVNVPRTPESKPRFWSGLGRGARGTGQLAQSWLAKRRARAMLKAGWKRKEEQVKQRITKMPKGKYIKKGTPGYEQLRRRQLQLAKARKKQGKEQGFRT